MISINKKNRPFYFTDISSTKHGHEYIYRLFLPFLIYRLFTTC